MIQAPTDNLYKFVAILGLLVVGFSVYLPLEKFMELGREEAKWSASWGPIATRAQLVNADLREEALCQTAERNVKGVQSSTSQCREVEAKREQLAKAMRDLRIDLSQLQATEGVLKRLFDQYALYRNIGVVTGLIGAFLSGVGFSLWHSRLQKPLDRAAERNPGPTSN